MGDEARGFGPFQNDFSLYFFSVNRGKKSLTLNLKAPAGKQIFHRLVSRSDILVENFRAGTMKKLGLDYEQLKETYPSLVYAACSGEKSRETRRKKKKKTNEEQKKTARKEKE